MSRRPLPPSSAMTRSWQVYPHNTDPWLARVRAALDAVTLVLVDNGPKLGLYGWAEARVSWGQCGAIELAVWRVCDLDSDRRIACAYRYSFAVDECAPAVVERNVRAALRSVAS